MNFVLDSWNKGMRKIWVYTPLWKWKTDTDTAFTTQEKWQCGHQDSSPKLLVYFNYFCLVLPSSPLFHISPLHQAHSFLVLLFFWLSRSMMVYQPDIPSCRLWWVLQRISPWVSVREDIIHSLHRVQLGIIQKSIVKKKGACWYRGKQSDNNSIKPCGVATKSQNKYISSGNNNRQVGLVYSKRVGRTFLFRQYWYCLKNRLTERWHPLISIQLSSMSKVTGWWPEF